MARNLFFNTCVESSDQSAFNSWGRQPYLTTIADGVTPSAIPADNIFHHNFVTANYGADGGCFDWDDGSSWYVARANFCMYGGHKSDFSGHSKRSFDSLYVYPSVYGPKCLEVAQLLPAAGFAEVFQNNTCILAAGQPVVQVPRLAGLGPAAFAASIALRSNTVYTPSGDAPAPQPFGNYSSFIAAGYDTSRLVAGVPDAATVMAWARALLF